MAERAESNSLCAIFALLIEEQLQSGDPDMAVVQEQLDNIKQNCSLMPTAAGETPDHLEDHLFDALDENVEGTVTVDGDEIPASAAERLE